MSPFFNRTVNRNTAKTSARRRRPKSLRIEGLEDRVVFSATTVSVPQNVNITEGASYQVPISRTGDLSQPLTVKYQFRTDPGVYADISRSKFAGTVTFDPGIRTINLLPITAVDDKIDEDDQYVSLDISVVSGSATIGTGHTGLFIKDNDAAPNVSITALEPTRNEFSGEAFYRISLDGPSEKQVRVTYEAQSMGTFKFGQDATVNHPSTYPGVLYLGSGQSHKDINVTIKDDGIIEPNETMRIALTGATNVTGFGQVKADVTIMDDDIPTVVVDDAGSIYEGNTAGATANFKVRVLEAMERAVQVKYTTAPGDATSASDYVGKSGTLTFGGDPRYTVAPSQQTVSVAIRADAIKEVTAELFYLKASPMDSTAANRVNLQKPSGKATIVDDDAPPRTIVGTPAPISAIPTPENGNGWGGHVQLRWAAASNAVRYEIFLRKENNSFLTARYDFVYPNFVKTPITGTTFQTNLLEEGAWFWQVSAVGADGTRGNWSSEQRFVIPENYTGN